MLYRYFWEKKSEQFCVNIFIGYHKESEISTFSISVNMRKTVAYLANK